MGMCLDQLRNGKRKYTTAKAESSEIAILPIEMTSAVTRLTQSIGATGAILLPYSVTLDLSAAQPGDIVVLMVNGGTGLETDPGDFGAFAVTVAG